MSTLNINTLSEETFEQKEKEHSVLSTELYIVDDSDDDHRTVVPSYDLLKNLSSTVSTLSAKTMIDPELSLTSSNLVANSTIATGIEKSTQEAIALADGKFAQIRQYKVDPVTSIVPDSFATMGGPRSGGYGNGKYVIATVSPSKYPETGKFCYLLSSSNCVEFKPIVVENLIDGVEDGTKYIRDIAYNAKTSTWFAAIDDTGMYKSTDLINWDKTSLKIADQNIVSVVDGAVYAGTKKGVYISEDNGDTWKLVKEGAFSHIAIHGNHIVMASAFNRGSSLIVSHDGGQTWNDLSPQFPKQTEGYGGVVYFKGKFVLHSSSATQIGGIFYSVDNGDTWIRAKAIGADGKEFPVGIYYAINHGIIFDTTGQYLASMAYSNTGTQKAVFITSDGMTWYPIANTFGIHSYAFAWTEQGIFTSGYTTTQPPIMLNNVDLGFKINLLGNAMMNIPILPDNATTKEIVDAINAMTSIFKIS